jgi:hypothetical protein
MLDQRSMVAVAYTARLTCSRMLLDIPAYVTHLTANWAGSCCSTPIVVTQGAEELIDVKTVQNLF